MRAWLIAGVSFFSPGFLAGGCVLGPAPFQREVEARPLGPVMAWTAPFPEPVATEVEPAHSGMAAISHSDQRPDALGDGDGSMMVADRVVVRPEQTPRTAPDFSPEQTASLICLAERTGLSVDSARRTHEATLTAARTRDRFEAGLASWRDVEAAEMKRQEAVRSFMMPVPLLDLFISTIRKKTDLPRPQQDGLVIENADLFLFTEDGQRIMAVSGIVRNTSGQSRETPPITLAALDAWEFQLAGQTSLLPFETLGPGEARAFETRFHNPPENTAEVYVHFAPPFAYRSRRDCDSYGAAASAVSADFGRDGERHAAAELNLLMQYYRRESAEAWQCRDWNARGCGWTRHALHWRDMFLMSEVIDAAWVAIRDGDEGAAAQAVVAMRRLGQAALVRAGESARDIDVAIATATHGRDGEGLYVEIAGIVTNTTDAPRRIDALMLAFVDRLELPLSSLAIPFVRTLAPGEGIPFSERIALTEAFDPDRPRESRWRRPAGNALARAPPQSIPWQMRVGAMAAAE